MSVQDEKIARMKFSSVYPLYLTKVERKGRTKAELDQVISWLTGLDEKQLLQTIKQELSFEAFFSESQASSPCASHHRRHLWLSCGGDRKSTYPKSTLPRQACG